MGMNKVERQRQLVKLLAIKPWSYTVEALATTFETSINSIYRDINELEANGYQFARNEEGRYFLKQTGWDGFSNIKDATIRQIEILRFIAGYKEGVEARDIVNRFTRNQEISEKTIERDLKELQKKYLMIISQDNKYVLNSNKLLPPLQLNVAEKSLLMEALAIQAQVSARKDEAKLITAKLRVSLDMPTGIENVVVHGRRPVENLRTSYYCQRLEDFARGRESIILIYRRKEEAAHEVRVNPLGIVYYWALDNWYLVAQESRDRQQIKTYSIDRILLLESTGENFSFPPEFKLEDWYKYSWGVFRQENPVKVKIRFYNYYSTIQRVKEELSSRETCVFREEDGDLIMEDWVDGIAEIAVWLRAFGPGAEVVEPEELREAVRHDFETMLETYGGR
jgi:predicted DNA-binding transcriptional regulator YafY